MSAKTVNGPEKKTKKHSVLNVLKGLGLSTAIFAAGYMSKGDNNKETPPEVNDKAAITSSTMDSEVGEENKFVEMDDDMAFAPDIHAIWRGKFAEARDSGQIDKANDLSMREGWHMPIDQNSVLWSLLSMNTPEFQKAYNSLDKVSRTYYNGYLDMIARGLQDIAQIQSPTSAHKNTADVNALFEAQYLGLMEELLKTDFTKDSKGNISQDAHDILVDYQLFQTASEQVLGPALSMYLVPELGYDFIKGFQRTVDQLKDPKSGKKVLAELNSMDGNVKKTSNKRMGPIGGHGR
ncbi:MAG: hypothetical protein II942_03010 [Alphaproteobacteria bacterium]|nr:hypothetical protein [Alphaproteobacteria bacterium]